MSIVQASLAGSVLALCVLCALYAQARKHLDAQTAEYRQVLQELDTLRQAQVSHEKALSQLQLEKQSLQESYNAQQKVVAELLQGSPAFRAWSTDGIDVDLLRGLFRADGDSVRSSDRTGSPDGGSSPSTSSTGGPDGKD